MSTLAETSVEGNGSTYSEVDGELAAGLDIGEDAEAFGHLANLHLLRIICNLGTKIYLVTLHLHTEGETQGARDLVVEVVVDLHAADAPMVVELVGVDEHWIERPGYGGTNQTD